MNDLNLPEAELIEKYQKLAETDPEFKEQLQSICDFLNMFEISVGLADDKKPLQSESTI